MKEFKLPKAKRNESATDYNIRKELAVLNFIINKLLTLDVDGRRRALDYLCDRYGVKVEKRP